MLSILQKFMIVMTWSKILNKQQVEEILPFDSLLFDEISHGSGSKGCLTVLCKQTKTAFIFYDKINCLIRPLKENQSVALIL